MKRRQRRRLFVLVCSLGLFSVGVIAAYACGESRDETPAFIVP